MPRLSHSVDFENYILSHCAFVFFPLIRLPIDSSKRSGGKNNDLYTSKPPLTFENSQFTSEPSLLEVYNRLFWRVLPVTRISL